MEMMALMSVRTGQVFLPGEAPQSEDLVLLPCEEAEPHYEQAHRSAAVPRDRTEDGRYDRSHLSPERAYRMGRDYLAHCIRYGWPMRVVRESIGPGAKIIEVGCGEEIPFFRALTCDHSAVKHYKPDLFVGVDLNPIKYNPQVAGCRTVVLPRTNLLDHPELVPDEHFDLVLSFEVLEHMDKPQGEQFLDLLVGLARRKPSGGTILLSTPVNDGFIAKNHIYEWRLSELQRAWEKRGCKVVSRHGTFANLSRLIGVLTADERAVWNRLAQYHGPHTLSCVFAALHPGAARNVAWRVEVV